MKILVASALILVGSCATLRHSEKINKLKDSIVYNDKSSVEQYLSTIDTTDLKLHINEITSEKYHGRKTGEKGHNEVCHYLRNYYDSLGVKAPKSHPSYFQNVPKEVLPEGLNDSQNVIAIIEGSEYPDEYIPYRTFRSRGNHRWQNISRS